jgi:guanidinopropionase
LVTLPILRGLAQKGPVGLIQFDAHTDLFDTYFNGCKFTHGTPFRRAIEEGLVDPKRMIQIGIRGTRGGDDVEWGLEQGIRIVTIEELYDTGHDAIMQEARNIVGDAPTYITFDIDSIDPSFAPGTGTPEIGGFTTFEAQRMVRKLQGLNLIGADLVEVSPPFDPSGNTAWVGASMMFELLCLLCDTPS